jgi:hypothetical protein
MRVCLILVWFGFLGLLFEFFLFEFIYPMIYECVLYLFGLVSCDPPMHVSFAQVQVQREESKDSDSAPVVEL